MSRLGAAAGALLLAISHWQPAMGASGVPFALNHEGHERHELHEFRQRPTRAPDIYFAPMSHAVADAMLKLARVTANDVVYDLGSGDGRIIIIAAQNYGARGVGVEIDPRLVAIARQNARDGAVANRVTFIEGDLFTADISAATVVTLYLSPGVNRDLEPKLRRELRPGARIVSHQFTIGNWPPDVTVRAVDSQDLFLWTVPPR